VIVSHEALLAAVHAHGPAAPTVTAPVPPSFVKDVRSGVTAYSQLTLAASWLTVSVRPAIVSVPERAALAVLGETVRPTLPVPVPLAPLAIVTQPTLDAAVHVHEPPVLTLTAFDPPAADIVIVVAERL
jgi:hypothetical protein